MATRPSAPSVHLINWSTLWPWVIVKKLDGSSTKYTYSPGRLISALLAAFALVCASPALAQTYATSTPSLSVYDGPAISDDDPQSGSLQMCIRDRHSLVSFRTAAGSAMPAGKYRTAATFILGSTRLWQSVMERVSVSHAVEM